jgi:hypothetical protein
MGTNIHKIVIKYIFTYLERRKKGFYMQFIFMNICSQHNLLHKRPKRLKTYTYLSIQSYYS